MAEPVKYQRMVLRIASPWNLGGETLHEWGVKFNLTGDTPLLTAEMEPTALDLWAPIRQLTSSSSSLVHWVYYPQGSRIKSGEQDYAQGLHPGDHSGYVTPAGAPQQQLEVAILAECPVGLNSRGRRVYLRKWIHDVIADTASHSNAHAPLNNATGILGPWSNGSGPKSLVPCDPTDGMQGGPWTFKSHLYTHQVRRGPKRKKPAAQTVVVPVPVP